MAEILLNRMYTVHGVYRRSSVDNLTRIKHLRNEIILHRGDMSDGGSIDKIVKAVCPDQIYNLADQDDVRWSNSIPAYSLDVTVGAVGRLLETIKGTPIRLFQPVSATMFGNAPPPQNEATPIDPQSPYACAKAHSYYLCRHYRYNHNVFVSTGIMFNHDSPGRSDGYFYQRVCREAVEAALGRRDTIEIGNPTTSFDVGYAEDYMLAAYAIMKLPEAGDFVVGSGIAPTVEQVARYAVECAGASERCRIVTGPGPVGPRYVADVTKYVKTVGHYPSVTGWKDLVQMLILHYRSKV